MKFRKLSLALALATSSLLAQPGIAAQTLSTLAERSGFQQTARYAEVEQLCLAFQAAYPAAVRCLEFGKTPEGRPMMALAASRSGALTAEAVRQRQVPVTLIQGGIHAGEIDGKDAGFLALREVLENRATSGTLDQQVLLFVPVFNVDGHERFGSWNRPNQRGPEQMGWRTTAQNLNLNRDYVKADAPEMQAMLQLVNDWDPLAVIDLHVTDGAQFEHDISIQVEPVHAGDAPLREAGTQLRDGVIAELSRQGSLPLPFYMAFEQEDDPLSGFADNVPAPRFSHGYFQLRNRFGMLVETHSWKDYPTRVRITHNAIVAVLQQVAQHGADWRRLALAADDRASQLAGKTLALSYRADAQSRTIAFRGYAYQRVHSDISGATMIRYDETRPQIWQVPLRDQISAAAEIRLPQGGYLVPAAYAAQVSHKLRQHGIAYTVLSHARPDIAAEQFYATKAEFSRQSFEGRQMLSLQGHWAPVRQSLASGSLFVPVAQPKVRLVAALFEPQAPDALLNWGTFNNAFEQKEYMEAYVAEDVARAQLAADPDLQAAFQNKLAQDAGFARDPAARLEFFARRHPSWDQRYQRYPVLRTDSVEE